MLMKKNKSKTDVRTSVITTLVTLLLIASIALCLFVAIQVLGKGYASFAGYSFFRVVTGSMEPEIHVGALILTKEVDIEALEIGDIISFRSKSSDMLGRIITHRIVGVTTSPDGEILLETKGDANLTMDSYYVDKYNLIGEIVWKSGEGNVLSDIVSFFTGKIGFMACIALPCLLISGIILRDSVNKIKGDMKRVIDELIMEEEMSKEQAEGKTEEQTSDEPLDEPDVGIESAEYEEMYERIRAELIEELKKGETEQQSEE